MSLRRAFDEGVEAAWLHLVKTGARAGVNRIKQLLGSGQLARAESLVRTPGVLKNTLTGSRIKALGSGAEGLAMLNARPGQGLEVEKLFDKGVTSYSPEIMRRRGVLSTSGHPAVAQQTHPPIEQPNVVRTFSEYVPQTKEIDESLRDAFINRTRNVKGFALDDLRPDNVHTTPTGPKAVDYVPLTPTEAANPDSLSSLYPNLTTGRFFPQSATALLSAGRTPVRGPVSRRGKREERQQAAFETLLRYLQRP